MIVTVLPQERQRGVHIPGGELDIIMIVTLQYQGDSGESMYLVGSLISS